MPSLLHLLVHHLLNTELLNEQYSNLINFLFQRNTTKNNKKIEPLEYSNFVL